MGTKEYKKYVLVGMASTLLSFFIMMWLIYRHHFQGALLSVCIQYALVGVFSILFVWRQKWFNFKNFFGRTNKEHMSGIAGYISMAIISAIALPASLLLFVLRWFQSDIYLFQNGILTVFTFYSGEKERYLEIKSKILRQSIKLY